MEIIQQQNKNTKTNGSVNLSGNDSYKHLISERQTSSKHDVIESLKQCTHKTPPRTVAALLDILFARNPSKEDHWLYIAQNYNPRAINRVLALMTKRHQRGDTSIQNPSSYFTALIKLRKKRRNIASSNDTYKRSSE